MSAAPDPLAAPAAACDPLADAFARDVLEGLSRPHKSIPCTWLYDRRGSELFELITGLDEYYPSRTETWVLEQCASEIGALAGPGATLVELGSGSSRKTRRLLAALRAPAQYVPVDISGAAVAAALPGLRKAFPSLPVHPLIADFTALDALPAAARGAPARGRRVVFFPGGTIGNFTPDAAAALLQRIGRWVGPGALLVLGADHTQDPKWLLPAYDDRHGITAAFNKNLLARINRELGGRFEATAFRHEARWNVREQRIEMHLVSEYTQVVAVAGHTFVFARDESIHTENAYKLGLLRLQALAQKAGWTQRQRWLDGGARFGVHVFERT